MNDNEFVTSDEKILSNVSYSIRTFIHLNIRQAMIMIQQFFSSMEATMSFMTTNRRHVKGR